MYKNDKILKIRDFITLKNTLLVKDSLEGNTPTPLQNYFTLARNVHEHRTRGAERNLVD